MWLSPGTMNPDLVDFCEETLCCLEGYVFGRAKWDFVTVNMITVATVFGRTK